MRLSPFVLAAVMLAAAVSPSLAARFRVVRPAGEGAAHVLIDGRLNPHDSRRFETLLERLRRENTPVALVALNSPGGYVVEGLAIAELVRLRRIDTYVAGMCASSCFNVFAAGANRLASREASIGVHMAFTPDGPSAEGTAAMVDLALRCGAPQTVIAKMKATAAPKISWLTLADMQAMHVRVTP
ncbi:MAG: ATP-dependent Clp protease proteolytic subunit [Alsobacter sp.]